MNSKIFTYHQSTFKPVKILAHRQKSLTFHINLLINEIFDYNLFKRTLKIYKNF